MPQIPNSQSFITGASGIVGTTVHMNAFQTAIDSVLVGLGRDIQLHLPPSKSPCTSADCRFNATYQRYTSANNRVCESCRGQGFVIEPRWTIYRANIRWTDEPYSDGGSKETADVGRLGQDFVRTKTVYSSLSNVRQAIGATIDGIDVLPFEEPRVTGFGTRLLYVITYWKVANK